MRAAVEADSTVRRMSRGPDRQFWARDLFYLDPEVDVLDPGPSRDEDDAGGMYATEDHEVIA